MVTTLRSVGLLLCGLFFFSPAHAADTPTQAELANRGKAATALVECKTNRVGHGTAFCVHPAGLFLTNDHVVCVDGQPGAVTLILDSGQKDQRVVRAQVLRRDADQDWPCCRRKASTTCRSCLWGRPMV